MARAASTLSSKSLSRLRRCEDELLRMDHDQSTTAFGSTAYATPSTTARRRKPPSSPPLMPSPPSPPSLGGTPLRTPTPGRVDTDAIAALLPVRRAAAPAGPTAGGHLPAHAHVTPRRKKAAERRIAELLDARDGSAQRAAFLEAGAHLWLAEELRVAASMLSAGAADPRIAADRLLELSDALQAEACREKLEQRCEADGGRHGHGRHGARRPAGVASASRAASSLHRAGQLRAAASSILEYAQALRHGGARGWVTVFGAGGLAACDPTIVPTLLALADSETALARARARPGSRPGATDHAHVSLDEHSGQRRQQPPPAPAEDGGEPLLSLPGGEAMSPVGHRAAVHLRRRLAEAGEQLLRGASLVADAATLLPPPPPDAALCAARVVTHGALDAYPALKWSAAAREGGGRGGGPAPGGAFQGPSVRARAWGSTIHPQHGGTYLGTGWRWRGGTDGYADSGSEQSDDAEEEERREQRARRGWRALRKAERIARSWEKKGYGGGHVCVQCVEREVEQTPTYQTR